MSLALARKYRPRNFAGVAVQSHVSDTLKGAIARDRVAHGYLLCGPRGVGKTTLARVLAMALNCDNRQPDGEPCGECTSCQRIWAGSSSLDVVEIDAASNRGVDDARDLRERAMYAPSVLEVAKNVFGAYVRSFNPGSFYSGTLAALVIVVVWVYYAATIFIVGGEVAQVYELRRVRKLQREAFED